MSFLSCYKPYLDSYNTIGFDAEAALVKYHLGPMTKLIVQGLLEDLSTTFGYPEKIMFFDYFNHSGICSLNGMIQNGCVWDIKKGTVLILEGDKYIT